MSAPRIVVLGLGLFGGGLGAARWALERGARVIVTDLRTEDQLRASVDELRACAARNPTAELTLTLGRHDDDEIRSADLVIVNPAIPPNARPLEVARAADVPLTTATALLLGGARCRFVGVTGTHGKSSTVRFLEKLCTEALPDAGRVVSGGNIGGSLLDQLGDLGPADVCVVELSSYQLEHLPALGRPLEAAIVTELGVDHLARHGSVEAYHAAKLRLLDCVRPGGTVVLDPTVPRDIALEHAPDTRVVARGDGALELDPASHEVRLDGELLGRASDLAARGEHQRWNLTLALAAARALGAPPDALARAVPLLSAPPHRIEPLGLHRAGGEAFAVFDNGVSTTPESTLGALAYAEAATPAPRVLLAGGQPKAELDLGPLTRHAEQNGWRIVGFGAAAGALEPGAPARTLEEAVGIAVLAAAGGCLLFSPACASFDAYPNFQARADAFRTALGRLTAPGGRDSDRSRD